MEIFMKGKKVDAQYVSEFITNCIVNGLNTPDKILELAKSMIIHIDNEIKEIDNKKAARSKLIDVVSAFEKPIKISKIQEARVLCYFKIQNPHICRRICNVLKQNNSDSNKLSELCQPHTKHDVVFCIKQLLEHNIICKSNNLFSRGEYFEDYIKFFLREGK